MPSLSFRLGVCLLGAMSFLGLFAGSFGMARAEPLTHGVFTDHQDVGTVLHPGSTVYDSAQRTYTLSGSGENMWFGVDDFQFAWKKVSGDVALTADIAFVGNGGNPHRKAVLMIRQTLDGDSPSVDIAVHGVGLTSLQFRDAAGANTHEVEANITAPKTVRIEKRGNFFYAFVSGKDGRLQPAGASTQLALTGDFYIGIGVCSHDKDVSESAVFSNVILDQLPHRVARPCSSARSRPSPSPPPIDTSNTLRWNTSRRRTGRATGNF